MLEGLTTETRNEKTTNLDEMSVVDFLTVMNEEDAEVSAAVKREIPQIAKVVEAIIQSRKKNGRLIYMGAGTSGRIGLLDAVECPPTFGTNPDEVIGLIAGGENAFVKAVEGAEDSQELGIQDLKNIKLNDKDVVIGIAASGRTPYVIGGLEYANSIGAMTAAICCNKNSAVGSVAKIKIEVVPGAEVLTGSTRLKAGTSQKLICNMISTAAMVGSGKVYGNLMVDVQLTNEKLVERAKHIVMEATSCDYVTAEKILKQADQKPKVAIVMILTGVSKEEALYQLDKANGFVRTAVKK